MNREDYLIELPNLSISQQDVKDLLNVADQYSDYWVQYEKNINTGFDPLWNKGKHFDPEFDWGCWLKYPHMMQLPIVQKIVAKLPEGVLIKSCSIMKSLPGFHLKAHKDPRDASLLFVLTPDPSPVYFLDDDGNFILEHTYVCPTVINTHVRHGTDNTTNKDRITFQIGIVQPWEEIVAVFKESGLA